MDAIFREAVKTVHAAFRGVAQPVAHEAFLSDPTGGLGEPARTAAVARDALVDRRDGTVAMQNGLEFRFRAVISFLDQVAVDPRDRITLSGGMTGPIHIPQGGTTDPVSGLPFARTVYLG